MRKNQRQRYLGTWGMILSANLLLAVNSIAADVIVPNWNLNNVDKQTRKLTTNFSGTGAVIGAGSQTGDVRNSSLTIDGLTVSTEDDPATAVINGSDFVAGGAVYHATASGNALIINNSTIQGRDLVGGAAFLDDVDNRLGTGVASNNTVSVKDSVITTSSLSTGGDVMGGYVYYGFGQANNNTVTIDNSSVAGNVYGGYAHSLLIDGVDTNEETGELLVDLNYVADNNTVNILNGSSIAGSITGSGGASSTGNTVLVDNSVVSGTVLGTESTMGFYDGAATAVSSFTNNTIILSNGANVSSAFVVNASSDNASENTLLVNNSNVVNGKVISVVDDLWWRSKDDKFINGSVSNNHLVYRDFVTPVSVNEVGGALNLSGTANANSVLLSNLTNLTVIPFVPLPASQLLIGLGAERDLRTMNVLNIAQLSSQSLFSIKDLSGNLQNVNNFNSSYGFVYGGASMQYNTQLNNADTIATAYDEDGNLITTAPTTTKIANGGTNSDGNTVTLANSNVKANIVGGFSGEIEDVHYTTWQYTAPSGSDPANFKKTVVLRNGKKKITTEYDCGVDGTSCTPTGTPTEADIAFDEYKEKVYSASNNTVVLDNSQVEGSVYGGFVVGADLKANNVQTANNTVVLRGNTSLTDDTVLYGGNSYFGRTTNHLVFDHISNGSGGFVTYKSMNQFQNFNNVWQINADLNTRINFDFTGVNALVNVDRSTPQGSAMIIKTKTNTDISGVEQNGVISDLADTSVELVKHREGVYSYSLTPTKQGASQVGWVLNSVKDHANAEVYGQLPLAGLALALEGPEMLSRTVGEAWHSEEEQNVFLNGGYHHTRYITGSGFDLNSGLAQAGFWKKLTPEWMGGFFVKYAGGHYKTFPIEAQGDASAYGGGLMSSLRYSDTGRLEASAQVGYMRLKFNSEELNTSLTSKTPYYGATVGIVESPLMDWALYTNFQFLRKMADHVTDSLGQNIHYKAVQSLALQAGTNYQFSQVNWNGLIPSLGVSGIYELDGKSKLEVEGLNDSTASLRGASARAEAGLFYQGQETMFPMTSSLTVFGQVGKRRGFGGEVNIAFQF